MPNESASTFGWLSRLAAPSAAPQRWQQTRAQMLGRTQVFTYSQDWLSDFWLARGSKITAGFLGPCWDPPDSLDDWPLTGEAVAEAAGLPGLPTNHAAALTVLETAADPPAGSHREALAGFVQWKREIQRHADLRMIQVEHVRAWMGTALGHLLMSVLLTPSDDTQALMRNSIDRLRMPLRLELPSAWLNDFEERRLDLLYNLRVRPDGGLQQSDLRVGQGEEWREHWGWLSQELSAGETLDSVRLAARLMRCPPLIDALLACVGSDDEYLGTVALAVLRRWLLCLKAMAWLESALSHRWEYARPADLSCFAFNALKPEWPRRWLAISHRSADVKPALIGMKLWKSGYCAIDANYAPSWETNTGMMWGLFAVPPVIARIESPRYRDSIWCRREIEVADYLARHGDYRKGRWILDVDLDRLQELDRASAAWQMDNDEPAQGLDLFNSFPPLCHVWAPQPMPEWEVKLYRAAGALRLINAVAGDPSLTNTLAGHIYSGLDIPGPAPTNNPDGWASYGAILRDLHSLVGDGSQDLPMRLPEDYSDDNRQIDIALSQRIPDLSTGAVQLGDTLVALEWLRTEWPTMVEQRRGDFILLNCQRLTREVWTSRIELSLHRGLAGARVPCPMWFLQTAGQEVENWPLVGERPIFTEHVRDQFVWMMEIFFESREAQKRFPADSGLALSPELVELCANAGSSPSSSAGAGN